MTEDKYPGLSKDLLMQLYQELLEKYVALQLENERLNTWIRMFLVKDQDDD